MGNKTLYSIIVPVYNGEKNIKKCIDNVKKQTYDNIELIIINDGSTDLTKEILDGVSDEKINIINKSNTGVSDSRNIGVRNAHGDYILFLDSDDELDIRAVENIDNKIENDVDIYLFGFKVINSTNRKNDTKVLSGLRKFEKKEKVIKCVLKNNENIFGYCWRCAYSRKMLTNNNIKFDIGIKLSEDYKFLLETLLNSDKIQIDENEYYRYIIGESSMTIKYIPSAEKDMMNINQWVYENIIKYDASLEEYYMANMCNTYLRIVQNIVRNPRKTSIFEKTKLAKKIKKKYGIQRMIKNTISEKGLYTQKTLYSLICFRFNLEFLYLLLFGLRERRRK